MKENELIKKEDTCLQLIELTGIGEKKLKMNVSQFFNLILLQSTI